MLIKQVFRIPKVLTSGIYALNMLPIVENFAVSHHFRWQHRTFSSDITNNTHRVLTDLTSIVDSGRNWDEIEPDKRDVFQATAIALTSADDSDFVDIKENFCLELKAALNFNMKDFKVVRSYSGFGQKLSIDCAIVYKDNVLALIALDEPNYFVENGELKPHHKIKEMLYNIKYRDSTCLFRLMVSELQTSEKRHQKIMKLVDVLLDVHYGGAEDKEDFDVGDEDEEDERDLDDHRKSRH